MREPPLYRRLSRVGIPDKSVVPVLDQWIAEGRDVDQSELRIIIKELRNYRRFKHALEISQWMTEKRYMILSASDVAVRLHLIAKVCGIEQAENFFRNTPKQSRTLEVYGALLGCYAQEKCVDKAEATLQKMRELGFPLSILNYNTVLSLYFRTGNREKADILMHELDMKGVKLDRVTYNILLNAYGAISDIDEFQKILAKIESDPNLDIDWNVYANAAYHYQRFGFPERAFNLLQKSEKLALLTNKKHEAFACILAIYATIGKREDVLRVWKKCKAYNVSNLCYKKMMSSILKFDDIDTAEEILEGWEASNLSKDFRVPNFLIRAYCEKGLMEKAESLIERANSKGWEKPNLFTWHWMSSGYVQSNQMAKAIEAMERAIVEHFPQGNWKPDRETLAACLKHLTEDGDADRSGNFVRLLQDHDIISAEVHARLVEYFSGEYAGEDILEGYGFGGNKKLPEEETD